MMENDASSNRARVKGSENCVENAENVSELTPLSEVPVDHVDEETPKAEDRLQEDGLHCRLRPNDSCPILHVTVPSTAESSPRQGRHPSSNEGESTVERNKLDNVSMALSEYQFSDSRERSLLSFNSTLPRGNASEAPIEMNDRTKSTTPVSSLGDAKDEEEQILEVLRLVVRKCGSLEPSKRPSSNEVHSILKSSLK